MSLQQLRLQAGEPRLALVGHRHRLVRAERELARDVLAVIARPGAITAEEGARVRSERSGLELDVQFGELMVLRAVAQPRLMNGGTVPRCQIDHLVITAPDLASGAEFVRRSLGIVPQAGGEHARMGTHNLLLKLGDSLYLEVISPDPAAPKPARPRWFQLDEQQPDAPSRLATWVLRTTDIQATLAGSSEPLGNIEPMSRGRLNWRITIPPDGRLPFDGVAPALIEWQAETHPASRLRDVGCSFVKLEAFHPEAQRISALFRSLAVEGEVPVAPLRAGERPYLVAHVQTPAGLRKLSGAAGPAR
jgi:hypothetical protein